MSAIAWNYGFPNGATYLVYQDVIFGNLGKWNISVPRGKEIKEIPPVGTIEKGTV